MMNKTISNRSRPARSLSATLATAFLTLSLAVLLISGGLQLLFNMQTQRQAVATRQQLIAQDAAKMVSSFVQEKLGVLAATVRLTNLATSSSGEQIRILDGLLGLQPAFRQLVLLDTRNREVALAARISRVASGGLDDRLESGGLDQVRQGQPYISPVYFDEVTSEPFVVMAVPATNALGDFQGTLLTEVNLKFMWDLVDQLKVGDTGLAYVVDRQGNLIAFKDTARVLKGENEQNLSPVSAFVSGSPSSATTFFNLSTGIQGETVVGSYATLGTPDWAVITELPWQEAYRDVIQATVASVGAVLGMALLASLMGVAVARQLAVPLVNLTETATRIAGGELRIQATTRGPKEVASLATAFNSMSISLQDMINREAAGRVLLETTVDFYLTFVEQVAQGDLTQRMELEVFEDGSPATREPLYVLGTNLNKMASSLSDMTARNAALLAEAQRAREAAEEANRVKSQFLASMSHELRTPLNAILNFNEMMSLGMVGPVTVQQVDVLNKALDSGKHLLALINDVLDISKIQSGSITLFVEQGLDLQAELAVVANATEILLKNKPVQFVTDIDSNLPIISGDKRRIRQILLNLLSNAAKFTEEGSVTLTAKRRNSEVLFSIKDTGPGIPKEQQVIIFEPFVQTSAGIQHAGGTGLGLPISKSFVEAHGGKLWVESEPTKGATFYFTLPITAATPKN